MARLRQLREDRGLSPTQLAQASKINLSQISRLESLTRPPVASQVVALCHFYGLDQKTTAELLTLAEPVRGDNEGWSRYLEEGTAKYLTFESDSKAVLTYQSMVFPGLLQAELYATAVVSTLLRPYFTQEQVAETVGSRMERRGKLSSPRRLELHAIIDESVFLRVLGGTEAMRQQLSHLLGTAEFPNVTVQVLPLAAGPGPGLSGSFSIFRFGHEELSDFAYVEDQIGQTFEGEEAIVERCKNNFAILQKMAASPADSKTMIERYLRSLGTHDK